MNFSLDQHRPSQALIHLDHLLYNARVLKSLTAQGAFFCPMVKANAYGHGDVDVARALEEAGFKTLGVGLIEEGLLLRGMAVKNEILYFGLFDVQGARACIEARLTPVLSSWEQVRALKHAIPVDERIKVHLKFDTGMHRLGFEPEDQKLLVDFFEQNPAFVLQGIMTHLHSGEDADRLEGESFKQLSLLQKLALPFRKWTMNLHSLNSAGLLNLATLRQRTGVESIEGVSLTMGARPGLALYGVNPLSVDQDLPQLKPVMSLRSKLVRIRTIEVGEGVSYCHSWRAQRKSWIGVVPVGYADGYHRRLSNRSEVLLQGRRVPVIGNICMDYLMIDLTDLAEGSSPQLLLWKEVTLFGNDAKMNLLPAAELAVKAETISWEILTSVGERIPRILQGK